MGERKANPALPPVVVTIRQGQPTPVQMAGWRQLWAKLLATNDKGVPAGGKVNQGKGEEESNDCQ